MPWKGVTMNEQRQRFLEDYKLNVYTTTDLADRFGISRRTAHKWIDRFEQSGLSGYHELSRRPLSPPLPPAPPLPVLPPAAPRPSLTDQTTSGPPTTRASSASAMVPTASPSPSPTWLPAFSSASTPPPRSPWRRPSATSPGSSRSSAFLIASALTMVSPSPPPPSLAYPPSPSGSSSSASTPSSSSLAGPSRTASTNACTSPSSRKPLSLPQLASHPSSVSSTTSARNSTSSALTNPSPWSARPRSTNPPIVPCPPASSPTTIPRTTWCAGSVAAEPSACFTIRSLSAIR